MERETRHPVLLQDGEPVAIVDLRRGGRVPGRRVHRRQLLRASDQRLVVEGVVARLHLHAEVAVVALLGDGHVDLVDVRRGVVPTQRLQVGETDQASGVVTGQAREPTRRRAAASCRATPRGTSSPATPTSRSRAADDATARTRRRPAPPSHRQRRGEATSDDAKDVAPASPAEPARLASSCLPRSSTKHYGKTPVAASTSRRAWRAASSAMAALTSASRKSRSASMTSMLVTAPAR